MIGPMIENLKNPKNVVTTLIVGYIGAIIGYFWVARFGRWEWVGVILGFLGILVMMWTLLRLALTKIIFGIIIGALLVVYFGWYMKSVQSTTDTLSFNWEEAPWKKETRKRMRPKYSDTGISQSLNEFVFAPAYIFDSTLFRRDRWDTKKAMAHSGWTPPKQ